jgi:hypothetical protein
MPPAKYARADAKAADAASLICTSGFNAEARAQQESSHDEPCLFEGKTGFWQFDRSAGHSESIVIGCSVRIWLR